MSKLKSAAEDLTELLGKSGLGSPLRIRVEKPSRTDHTGGFCVTVATFGEGRPDIEVWYDKWFDGKTPIFWAGFGAQKAKPIRQLISDSSGVVRKMATLTGRHVQILQNGQSHLIIPPNDDDLAFPFQEYHGDHNGYGLYSKPSGGFEVVTATLFILSVLRALQDFANPEDYAGIENRQIVGMHITRERDMYLGRLRKERDKYRCQVCDFDFEEFYGPLRKPFAEAHHILPLASLIGPVKNSIDLLRTVCANCHRMLHQEYEGSLDDMDDLRARVKRNRRRGGAGSAIAATT